MMIGHIHSTILVIDKGEDHDIVELWNLLESSNKQAQLQAAVELGSLVLPLSLLRPP